MNIIDPYFIIESEIDGNKILRQIENAGRTAYKSNCQLTDEQSSKNFVSKIIESNHLSVIEHESVTVRIICDRGVSRIGKTPISELYTRINPLL